MRLTTMILLEFQKIIENILRLQTEKKNLQTKNLKDSNKIENSEKNFRIKFTRLCVSG